MAEQDIGIFPKNTALPSPDTLGSASREEILGCLNLLEKLHQQGRRPPEGYLFALSREVERLQRQD